MSCCAAPGEGRVASGGLGGFGEVCAWPGNRIEWKRSRHIVCGVGSRMICVFFSFFATDVVHEIDTLRARNLPSLELLLLFVHQLVLPPRGGSRGLLFLLILYLLFIPLCF